MKDYKNVIIFNHPLIKHKIAILRDEKTSMKEFRELIEEITTLMTYECLKEGVPTVEKIVKTPLETCTQQVVKDNSIVIVPILRADWEWLTEFTFCSPRQGWDISVCTATRKRWSRRNITASCPTE